MTQKMSGARLFVAVVQGEGVSVRPRRAPLAIDGHRQHCSDIDAG